VFVAPGEPVWIDAWVPTGDPLWSADVGRAFDWLGDTWVRALGAVGVEGVAARRGPLMAATRWSGAVCFGGVGTGEVVTAGGRKVVGLAQRRDRAGAWFHGACVLYWDARPLTGLLGLAEADRAAAAGELGAAVQGAGDILSAAGDERRLTAESVTAAFLSALD
jgi:hypothetical protein